MSDENIVQAAAEAIDRYMIGVIRRHFEGTQSWSATSEAEAVVAAVKPLIREQAFREAADQCTPAKWTGPAATLIHLNHWLTVKADRESVIARGGQQ